MKKRVTNFDEYWRNILRRMKKDELLHIVYEHESYSPKLVAWTKDELNKQYGMTEDDFHLFLETDNFIEGETGTRSLFLEILRKMGCGDSIYFENDSCEDDGCCDISFSYMNCSFYASAQEDRVYVDIERAFYSCRLEDENEVVMVKEAINEVNKNCYAKMYCLMDETSNRLYVNSCYSFLLILLIPELDIYLHMQFKALFKAEQFFSGVLEDLKVKAGDQKDGLERK